MNTMPCQQATFKSSRATIVKPGNAVRAVFIAGSRSPAVSTRRRGVNVNARSQNFAYLNVKAKQQTSTSATSGKSTSRVVPELSNLLPFLSAWGALMLSEGAGLPEWLVLLNLTWGAGASVAAGIVLEKIKTESKPIQMRLDNAPMGVRRGGKLPMKDLVKAADGNIEGLKHLLKTEWELPEDTRVAVYGIDCDGVEFEFTPMVAHDLLGTLAGAQAVLLRVLAPAHLPPALAANGTAHGHAPPLSSDRHH